MDVPPSPWQRNQAQALLWERRKGRLLRRETLPALSESGPRSSLGLRPSRESRDTRPEEGQVGQGHCGPGRAASPGKEFEVQTSGPTLDSGDGNSGGGAAPGVQSPPGGSDAPSGLRPAGLEYEEDRPTVTAVGD